MLRAGLDCRLTGLLRAVHQQTDVSSSTAIISLGSRSRSRCIQSTVDDANGLLLLLVVVLLVGSVTSIVLQRYATYNSSICDRPMDSLTKCKSEIRKLKLTVRKVTSGLYKDGMKPDMQAKNKILKMLK